MEQNDKRVTRRELLKATYAVPVILTLAVSPAFASGGSGTADTQGNPNGPLPPESNSRYPRPV